MKKLTGVFLFALLALAPYANADTGFLGLWQGVDPLDGGRITLSVSDPDQDGVLDLRFNDTFIRACQAFPDGEGRGVFLGNAVAQSKRLIDATSGSFAVEVQIFCNLASDVFPPGVHLFDVQWEFTLVGKMMIEMTGTLFAGPSPMLDMSGNPAKGGDVTMRFHRISQ